MYQLFVFFMITDPKTTVRTKWGQCVVAFLVAVAEMILRLNRVVHAPYYALFLVGPAANAIEIWWNRRHRPPVGRRRLAGVSVPRVISTSIPSSNSKDGSHVAGRGDGWWTWSGRASRA